MDETPEELERIRRRGRRHRRPTGTSGVPGPEGHRAGRRRRRPGLAGAARCSTAGRNPCERVRDHLCRADGRTSVDCPARLRSISQESLRDESPTDAPQTIRAAVPDQDRRLKQEDGVIVR